MTLPRRQRRRRFRISLNGLAIQLSAMALSFTLVALLVVGSTRAAFVEENDTVADRVPVGLDQPEPVPGAPSILAPRTSTPPAPSSMATPPATPAPTAAPAPQRVDLLDDAAGTAMFADSDGLIPGVPEERCIRVTYDGNADVGSVLLYAADVQGALAPYLDVVVEMGAADVGSFGDCSAFAPESSLFAGTLAAFGAEHGSYDAGLTTWEPAGAGEARTFRFTVSVRDDPAAEGLATSFGFSWETRG